MDLTSAQKQAIEYSGRNLQLIACAGSGKTEVVSQRVAHLLTKHGEQSLEPRNIVAFTFTEKAAAELKERITRRTREAAGGDVTGMAEMYVGTIHGFCQDLLQKEAPEYLKYEVLDRIRQTLYVNRKSQRTGLTTSTKLDGTKLRRYRDTNAYLAALAVLREDDVDEQLLEGCSLSDGLNRYRSQLAEDSYFDFSSMLEATVDQLRDNETLRSRIGERVKYVVVDEYQDVNPVQERLVRLLHELGAGVCVVGDDDQTIYQWRGSSVGHILGFEERYPYVESIRLEENFRSSEGVIETARGFIEKVSPRLPKSMKFAEGQPYEKGDVVALHFESPEEEAKYIAETIKSLYGVAFKDGDGERGLSWSDMAVLLRSVKGNGGPIAEAFKAAGIPFVVTGLANLFETEEARAARDLFHFIAGEPIKIWDEVVDAPGQQDLSQSWKDAGLGLDDSKLAGAVRYAKQVYDDARSEGSRSSTIQHVFRRFLELAELREENVPDGRGQVVLSNLGKFSQAISDWESVHFRSVPLDSFQGFANFLYYQAEAAYDENSEEGDYFVPDAVQIMTVHKAKGKEWPVVFLPALLRNRFPSSNWKSSVWRLIPYGAVKEAERYDGSKDDERRLFYVAMTRSKKFLHMTWAPIEGKSNWYVRKSEFWDDVIESKWVQRRRPDYANRPRLEPQPRVSVSDIAFSFSDLKYLHECPYQFKLQVLYGFNSPIVPPMGYGKSLHDALAEVHRRAMRGEEVSEADAPELVARHLRTPYASEDLRQSLEKKAFQDIANYINDNADQFQYIEFSEQDVEIHLGDGVSVRGRIDLVRRTDRDETTIVDMKSNQRSQHETVTENQLHTYALGYKELTGRDADSVEIYELDERRPRRRSVDEVLIDNVRRNTREAAEALRTMRLEPAPSRIRCGQCDSAFICSSAWPSPAAG